MSAGAPSAVAVEARGLSRRYGRTWALSGVNFAVPAGQVTLLAGHNGSGKSTLLRVIAGALRPDRGTLRVHGYDALEDRTDLRRQVALLGHASYAYSSLSPLHNLQIAARLLGRRASRDDLLPHLAQVGLAERADDPIHTFSAGMVKRLALARVLLQDPKVLLLDEPYGALDPAGFVLIDDLLARMRAEGRTVLVASHLIERGANLCDHAIVLHRGRLAWSGPARDVPEHASAQAPAVGPALLKDPRLKEAS